ncbi:phospholipase D active site protein motif protein [Penicillium brasilianum]|uniref:Phospholipase D active site protein motif protein n=1 Tax=Penicillium brasilianum TaxID=104259 RepID=A0A1S9RB09_PENBI|nr:phospholipase D active site protein motif protein [Penicillium brasilianum]
MVTDRIYSKCNQAGTVTSELAKDPSQCPGKIFKELYETHDHSLHPKSSIDGVDFSSDEVSSALEKEKLQKASSCGNWGASAPSELFLKVYHGAISSLDKGPSSGVVSPPLMGSTGVVPLTIVAPLPDLCRHLANCIARAKHEVFLGTNFWVHSDASTLITNAIRELSNRAGQRGEKVIMKMIYDRGNPRQAWENRLTVPEEEYSVGKVRLPAADEIPNVDLQVINYHRPIFGTFHAKFTVIDRRIALLQSSNIQDNDNLEMLSHIEGPIVDSFYDAALLSWGKPLDPPLPLLNSPAKDAAIPCNEDRSPDLAPGETTDVLPEHTTTLSHYDMSMAQEAQRVNSGVYPKGEESLTQAVTRHLNTTIQPETTGDAPDSDQEVRMTPYTLLPPHDSVPMALVNREPYGAPNHNSINTPQNGAWLSAINNAQQSIFIQTPNMNAEPLLEPLLNAVRRGVIVTCYLCLGYNDAGELLPFQNGTNEMIANRLYKSLDSEKEKAGLQIFYYVGKDQTKPIHNSFKKRSCHIKLMIVDEQIAIQGNGNLDTQSFFHSQEINVLIDSSLICKEWLRIIHRNQNTAKYGAASVEDGCWHDPVTGEIPPGSIGIDPGRFSWARGVIGAVKRVRGVGGF